MPDILTKRVDLGFDANIRDASELPRGSADDGSQNVLYSRFTSKTPFGFAQVEPTALPLDSGNPVLGMAVYAELDKTQHFLAVTNNKIFRRDTVGSTWSDITQSGQDLGANLFNPVSFATALHTDGLALNGTGSDWFQHCVVSSGVSPIQRWAGNNETDFADLEGADGYHTVGSGVTTHQAAQVGVFFNRLMLVNPKEADINGTLFDNNQRVRFPQAGKLESWSGNGSGFYDLLDTGGFNIWGAKLGAQWIQYQNNSIWSLTHVGGKRVFEPDIEMPELGLLAPHLIFSKNNIHYFVGNDFNVYAYLGGKNIQKISKNIDRYLRRDLDPAFALRSWLTMGAENSRLWLYIVSTTKSFAVEAYAIDMITGNWMKRDFTHRWTTSTTGISSVALVPASSVFGGASYNQLLSQTRRKPVSIAIGGAVRSSNVVTVTTVAVQAFIVGDIVVITGTKGASLNFTGTFEITSVADTTHFTYAQVGANEASTTTGKATVNTSYRDSIATGETYRQALREILSSERIALGDSDGFVYQYNDIIITDDNVAIPSTHITETYDLGRPSQNKIWPNFYLTAKGTSVVVSYRTGNFQTTGTGWTVIGTLTLTSEFTEQVMAINDTSKRIQFKFFSAGPAFQISNYGIEQPVLEGKV